MVAKADWQLVNLIALIERHRHFAFRIEKASTSSFCDEFIYNDVADLKLLGQYSMV